MSAVDICNRALSDLGTRSTIAAFNEGSAESIQCSLWYDAMRKMLLRAAPWGFARAQAVLSPLGQLVDGTSPYPWPYKYLYPPGSIKLRYILPPVPTNLAIGAIPDFCAPSRSNRFIVAQDVDGANNPRKVLLATLQDAQMVYVIDTTDTSLFDDAFTLALSAALAAKMCLSLTGNAGMKASFEAAAQQEVTNARVADGNEAMPTTDHTPDWIEVRGSGSGYPNNPLGNLGNWYFGWDNLNWGS